VAASPIRATLPLSGYCSPYHTNSALYPIIGLLERAAGFELQDPTAVALAKLEALLALGARDLEEVVPLVAELLGIPVGEKYPLLNLTPERQKAAAHSRGSLVDQVAGLAKRHARACHLRRDAHWIDPTTLELLGLLIERVQKLPVLVLITHRPSSIQIGRATRTSCSCRSRASPEVTVQP